VEQRKTTAIVVASRPAVLRIASVDEDFIGLIDVCPCVLRDSGGVQEEVPSLRKPGQLM
jgi:UDP-N-acetylglucosamine 2-epimerase